MPTWPTRTELLMYSRTKPYFEGADGRKSRKKELSENIVDEGKDYWLPGHQKRR